MSNNATLTSAAFIDFNIPLVNDHRVLVGQRVEVGTSIDIPGINVGSEVLGLSGAARSSFASITQT